jgi:predicted aspartyl protease
MRRAACAVIAAVLAVWGPLQAPAAVTHPATALRVAPGGRILIAATVNGVPVDALLDSAAETSLADTAFARRIRLAGGTQTAARGSGKDSISATVIPGVTLGAIGLVLKNQTIAVTELGDVGHRLLGRRLDFILGREIFDAARLQIDLRGRRMTVLDRARTPPGERLVLVQEHGVETVPVTIEGRDNIRATFDLGNGSGVLISAAFATRMRFLQDGRAVRNETGGGLGGAISRPTFDLHSLKLAGIELKQVAAAIDSHENSSDANVGISVLEHFLITTDFSQRAVWLAPLPASTPH